MQYETSASSWSLRFIKPQEAPLVAFQSRITKLQEVFQTESALVLDVPVGKSAELLLYKHLLRVLQEQEVSPVAEQDLEDLDALSKSLLALTEQMKKTKNSDLSQISVETAPHLREIEDIFKTWAGKLRQAAPARHKLKPSTKGKEGAKQKTNEKATVTQTLAFPRNLPYLKRKRQTTGPDASMEPADKRSVTAQETESAASKGPRRKKNMGSTEITTRRSAETST